MRLESVAKFHSPKSPTMSDSPRATASDSLSGTDVMAAMGMAQSQAGFGMAAFCGKHDLSQNDKQRAIELLTQFAIRVSGKYRGVAKLEGNIKRRVVQALATFAYADYCRSAAGKKECPSCAGKGLIPQKGKAVKSHYFMRLPQWAKDLGQSPSDFHREREVEEVNHVLCKKCNGKGVISTACRDCNGTGRAMDIVKTELYGRPVEKDCGRCGGVGYSRMPASAAYRAVSAFIPDLTQPTWSRTIKPLYDAMVVQCHKEESIADNELAKVTR
ncbi:antitermination protein [Pectobacterium carotovorum subsp. carotovorum]|nr:antitermination protein [Pectobacterium carotovorum subsp. carotovorum]